MQLPRPRGLLTEALFERLLEGGTISTALLDELGIGGAAELLRDDDGQLALWCLYELHYRGFDDVDDRLEWAPDLIALRGGLEELFEAEVRALVAADAANSEGDVVDQLRALVGVEAQQRPRLASYLGADATADQFAEFLVVRSVYHLKESDPQSFVLPRIGPGPKAALAELQYDEYGDGRPERVHQQLFADALQAMGLDAEYGAQVDRAPAVVLAESNVMSLFALNRRLRGAALGHLAAFEATSSVPCRFIATGARRLGLPDEVARYYTEHVEADSIHEQVAIREICGRLVEEQPGLAADVLLGARACLALADRCAADMLDSWQTGRSPLLPDPVEPAA